MRKPWSFITPLLFLSYVLIISPTTVEACNAPVISPDASVKSADVIVRAAPIESIENEGVKFKILEVLKGSDVPSNLIIKGFLSKRDDYNERPVPYWHVRPSGSGLCYAYEYKEGAEFLLLLKEQDGKLTPYWYPLAPTNEQLRPGKDAWLVWVKDFLRSQKDKEEKDKGIGRHRDFRWLGFLFTAQPSNSFNPSGISSDVSVNLDAICR
jgi:hypothetical protein